MSVRGKGSISDTVYEGLRKSIITLKLKPGDEININSIAENMSASRSPVRDALLRLEKEGLVDIMPQKGTRVSRIDLALMHEERFLRATLEEKIIGLCIKKQTHSDLVRMETVLQLQKKSLETPDFISFLDYDDDFHQIFFEAANKRMCWEIVQSTSGHYRRFRLLILRNASEAKQIYAQHLELFEMIRKKHTEDALDRIRAHLSKIIIEEIELREEYPDYFTNPADSTAWF